MDEPTVQTSLAQPLHVYCNYFVMAETDIFCGRYAAVLYLYHIDMANTASNIFPQLFSRKIYTAAHEGIYITLLQWHQGAVGGEAQISRYYNPYKITPPRWVFPLLHGATSPLT